MLTDGRRTKSDDNSSPGLRARWAKNAKQKCKLHKKAIFLISIENTMDKINISKCCCLLCKINWIKIQQIKNYQHRYHDDIVICFKIIKYISELVNMQSFWNSLRQVCSKSHLVQNLAFCIGHVTKVWQVQRLWVLIYRRCWTRNRLLQLWVDMFYLSWLLL